MRVGSQGFLLPNFSSANVVGKKEYPGKHWAEEFQGGIGKNIWNIYSRDMVGEKNDG